MLPYGLKIYLKQNNRKENKGLSETEKLRRKNYKRKRSNLIIIQAAIIALFVLFSSLFFITYTRVADTYEIPYAENGDVDYTVNLLPNEDYEAGSIGSGFSYIASLIDTITADFSYTAGVNSQGAKYYYSYRIIARMEITNNENGKVIFECEDILKLADTQTLIGVPIRIDESVEVDYSTYDADARSFLKRYGLGNVTPKLIVSLVTHAEIREENLNCDGESGYVAEMIMPLARTQVDIEVKKNLSSSDVKLLVSDNAREAKIGFLTGSLICGGLALLLLLLLVAFIFLTRNHDINYSIKVKRIINAYKSYIQKINNAFDTDGYQLLYIDTFSELLSISDKLQSPILMYENEDETKTVFIIPTLAHMLYLYEIKVENYDEIYAIQSKRDTSERKTSMEANETALCADPSAIEPVDKSGETEEATPDQTIKIIEESAIEIENINMSKLEEDKAISEPVVEDTVAEAVPDLPMLTSTEVPDVTAEDNATFGNNTRIINGNVVHVRYRTSFMSRLIQSAPSVQEYYSTVKNRLLCFKGVKARTSWSFESFNKGRLQCAKLNVKGSTLLVYLALDPKEYNAHKYYFTDVSDKPKLFDVPMLLKIKSERSLKYTLELIDEMMRKADIELIGGSAKNYCMPYESTEELIEKNLIKVLLPAGEKLSKDSVIKPTNVSEIIRDAKERERENPYSYVETHTETEQTLNEAIGKSANTPDIISSRVNYVNEIDEVDLEPRRNNEQ